MQLVSTPSPRKNKISVLCANLAGVAGTLEVLSALCHPLDVEGRVFSTARFCALLSSALSILNLGRPVVQGRGAATLLSPEAFWTPEKG